LIAAVAAYDVAINATAVCGDAFTRRFLVLVFVFVLGL
jgi:hypothetical protein